MNEIKSADLQKLAEHLRKGAKFDVMKGRERLLPSYDNHGHGDVRGAGERPQQDEGPMGYL